jgi:putative nucleotidyltransferase with HDIG domain
MRLYLPLLLLSLLFSYGYWNYEYEKSVNKLLDNSYMLHQKRLDEVIYSYRINSDVTFKNVVMRPKVLSILDRVDKADQEEQSRLRQILYDHLLYDYTNLKEIANVRQFHFHRPDGVSFLRMHRPNKFGDPLFDVRYSLKVVNEQKRYVEGFEEGRIYNGYRFVYPIAFEGRHLGSVEISVSVAALTNSLQKVYDQQYCFMLDSSVVGKKVFESEKSNYAPSPFGSMFAIDKEVENGMCTLQNPAFEKMQQNSELAAVFNEQKPFSDVYFLQSGAVVVHMLPVFNVKGEVVAYFYVADHDTTFGALKAEFLNRIIITSVMLIALFGVLFGYRRRQQHLEEQRQLLEQKVYERTKMIELSLQKERYVKNVLETVFDVSEHLSVADKIDNVLYECCERITIHDFYQFAHVRLFDENIDIAMIRSLEEQGIDSDTLEQFYARLEHNEALLKKIHLAETIVDNDISKQAYASPLQEYIHQHHIKSMLLIPLVQGEEQNEVFGYMLVFASIEHDLEEELLLFKELGQAISKSLLSLKRKDENEALQKEKLQSYRDMIFAMVDLTEKRDTYTAGHTRRVSKYCLMIGEAMGLNHQDLVELEEAAMLHDIGKIVTPDSILLKPGSLNQQEYSLIQEHVNTGAEILDSIHFYKRLRGIMMYHHEKYDGTGYPFGLKGDEIPLLSRIMSIADAFDAMTTNRIYKPRKDIQTAINEIEMGKAKHFDPDIADIAIKVLQNVSLDIGVNQLPSSGPDYERMAYHFKDALTGLYNRAYLKVILDFGLSGHSFECANLILLHNFHQLNSTKGWDNGNELLVAFARKLDELFSDAFLFRVFGDDFLVLNYKHVDITSEHFKDIDFLVENNITVSVEHYDMREDEDKTFILHMLENHM